MASELEVGGVSSTTAKLGSSAGSAHGDADDLIIGNGSSTNAGITLNTPSAGGYLYFADGSSGDDLYRGFIKYVHSGNAMEFGTDAVSRLSISSTGKTTATGSSTNGSGLVDTLQIKNGGTSAGDGGKLLFTAGTSTNGAGIGSTGQALNSADLKFYTGGSNERLHIHHSTGLATFSGDVAYGDNARVYHGNLPSTGPGNSNHDKFNFNFTFSGTYGVALITLDIAAGAGEVSAGRFTLGVASTINSGSTTQLLGSVSEVFKHNLSSLTFADSGSSNRTFTLSVERTVTAENWQPNGSYKIEVTNNNRTLTLNSVTAST
ncbi:MAG: hypothetical protein CL524_11905 [Aequorivita sp.]|nr:hypothetical protein [Aequorivita sp.]